MAASSKYTDADRARVLNLHAEGKGRNDIGRETGYPNNFISVTVQQAGKSFARTERVQAATAAKTIDNRARRVAIISRMYGQAEAVLDRLENPGEYKTMVKAGGGSEAVEVLDFIPPTDRRNELTSVGISLDKAITLEKVDTDNGAENAKSMLDRLTEQLQGAPLDSLDLGTSGEPSGSESQTTPLPEDQ